MIGTNKVLLGLSANDLEDWAVAQGQPAFRGRQIHDWLYNKGVDNLELITVLPKTWRNSLLEDGFRVGHLNEIRREVALDSTIKLLLETCDGLNIEAVGIPTKQRMTVCVSSQVGCSMGCKFCATGKGGLQRSLAAHEIVSQVINIREAMGRRPSNVVFMGMGEPLLNTKEVLFAIRSINHDLGIGQRRITLSTVGVANTLPDLAQQAVAILGRAQFTLAISLHAPNQALREQIIPTASSYPFEDLLEDCRKYLSITGRRVSFEYILLGDLNDQPEHAIELAQRLKGFQSHVNLIPYNPIGDGEFNTPSLNRVCEFRNLLERKGIASSIRRSRGGDKNAACGQLRRHHLQTLINS